MVRRGRGIIFIKLDGKGIQISEIVRPDLDIVIDVVERLEGILVDATCDQMIAFALDVPAFGITAQHEKDDKT